jgi:hypothetical protein
MTKKWIAINLLLLLGAGLLGWQLYVSAKKFNAENDIARIQVSKKKTASGGLPSVPAAKTYNEGEFGIIPAQNLFAESRKLEAKTEAPVVVETPPLDVKPIITSIVIAGSSRIATIVDPSSPNMGGAVRRAPTLQPGDTYRGYVVTDITEDGLVLELGTRREIIPIHDPAKHPKQGSKTPILATRVVNFGPGTAGSTAGASPAIVTSTAAASTRPGASTTPGGGGRATQQGNPAQQPGGGRGRGAQGVMQMDVPRTWNQTVDSEGRVIINSPFGAFPVQQTPPTPPIKK